MTLPSVEDKRHRALKLRVSGVSYAEIARSLGMSKSGVIGMVRARLKEIGEEQYKDALEYKWLQLSSYDMIIRQWTPLMMLDSRRRAAGEEVTAEDVSIMSKATDKILAALDKKGKLMGLDLLAAHQANNDATSSVQFYFPDDGRNREGTDEYEIVQDSTDEDLTEEDVAEIS